jgi:FkbM family methyltransferase
VIRSLDYRDSDLQISIDAPVELDVRRHSCEKEQDTVRWLEDWFRSGEVFYDVGANIGAYSLIAARKQVRVYAFEPGFMTFPQLCRNIHLNQEWDSIVPLQLALSDETDLAPFNYENLDPGGALHALGEARDQKGENFSPVMTLETPCYRIDDLVSLMSLPRPNHIKIDVDGIEYAVLRGAEAVLRERSVKSILLESEEELGALPSIQSYLRNCGLILEKALPRSTYLFVRP